MKGEIELHHQSIWLIDNLFFFGLFIQPHRLELNVECDLGLWMYT